jgi:hypothetical protein
MTCINHVAEKPLLPALLFVFKLHILILCSQWFSPEMPEWDMEKYRFYLDLPGDFWESGTLLRYLREREVQVRAGLALCCASYIYIDFWRSPKRECFARCGWPESP